MKQKIYFILSLLVTIGVMGYLFRIVSVEDVFFIITNISLTPLICFVVLSFGHAFFQTWRYQVILHLSNVNVSNTAMFLVTTVRNMFSDLLPARIGTLSYVYLLSSRLNIALEKALPSFAVAFLFDMIAIVPLILLSVLGIGWKYFSKFAILIPISLGMLIGLLIILRFLPEIFKVMSKICSKVRFLEKWATKLNRTAEEIAGMKRRGIYFRVFVLSLAVRLCKYAKLYFLLLALLYGSGYGWKDLGFGRFFLGISSAEFSASLPISGIAAFGAYEGTWAFMFSILGFPKELAILTGISHHLITQIFGYMLGTFALLILLLPVFKAKPLVGQRMPSIGRFVTQVVFSLALLCGMLFSIYTGNNLLAARSVSDTFQKKDSKEILSKKKLDYLSNASEKELKALETLAKTIRGEIIYTRKGRVHKVTIGEWQPKDLGEGEFVRWGPEGKRIAVYGRGQIYVMDANGNNRKRLIPVKGKIKHNPIEFHTNGKEIIYAKPGEGLWAVKIDTGKSKVLDASKAYNGEPGISADGKQLATRHGKNLYAIDLVSGKRRKYGRGCSSGISPDGKHLMNNIDGQREMFIHSWDGKKKKRIYAKTTVPDKKWDNHHWSNDNDYIAAQGSGKFGEAYLLNISKNLGTRVTWEGSVVYPDLFVKNRLSD